MNPSDAVSAVQEFSSLVVRSGRWGRLIRLGAVVSLLAGGTMIVYGTGGTQFVWPHLLYFPVVLSGVAFGRRAGALTGVTAGILMGPLMPLDVAADVAQPTRGWLIRLGFYVAVGLMAGYARYRFYRLLDRRRKFLASVSHELRTPLSGVVGFAEILGQEWDGLTETQKLELVDHIRRESGEVAQVVDDLLVASRLETGQLHIHFEPVDVRLIADSIVDAIPPDLHAGRIRVDGAGESWADPIRVRHIVRNLLTNALIHGGENVAIDLASTPETVTVTIRDDGHQPADMSLPQLFQPLLERHTVATMPQSAGLGLAVARELARRMGGRLSYRREDGDSVFTLELPASANHKAEAASLV